MAAVAPVEDVFLAPWPTLGSFGTILNTELDPMSYDDPLYGYPLMTFMGAVGTGGDEVNDLVRETDIRPGWGLMFDVDNVPSKWLPWLGQFSGTSIDPALNDNAARAIVAARAGFTRGRPSTITNIAKGYLTGTQYVLLEERYNGDPYTYSVIVQTDQVTDAAQLNAALTAAKPAGLNFNLYIVDVLVYSELQAISGTYAGVLTHYPTYRDMHGGV